MAKQPKFPYLIELSTSDLVSLIVEVEQAGTQEEDREFLSEIRETLKRRKPNHD